MTGQLQMKRCLRSLAPLLLMGAWGCGGMLSRGHETALFDGKDLAGWQPCFPDAACSWQAAGAVSLNPSNPHLFAIEPGSGILVNGPKGETADLRTQREFGDCELHLEFVVSKHSNSGIYLLGEYEIQILDSYGHDPVNYGDCGGIYAYWMNDHTYGGYPPRVNASKPPGEWQTFDIVFRAPRFDSAGRKTEKARVVSVKLNGIGIHENVSLDSFTAGPLWPEERAQGPVRLQGDHGPVAFRNMLIRPLRLR